MVCVLGDAEYDDDDDDIVWSFGCRVDIVNKSYTEADIGVDVDDDDSNVSFSSV